MSDFYNKYPYTDFHELNLDWVIERVKKLTEDWLATQEAWNNTQEEWQQLYDYVHDYFANLDVQDEINNKINQMILDGTFLSVVAPTITQTVTDTTTSWLAEHITQPTTPAIDNTLTIAGAAADSKAAGDAVTLLRHKISEETRNLYSNYDVEIGTAQNGSTSPDRATCFIDVEPSTQYLISCNSLSNFDAVYWYTKPVKNTVSYTNAGSVSNYLSITTEATTHCLAIQFNKTSVSSSDFASLRIQIEENTTIPTEYIEKYSATDYTVREELAPFLDNTETTRNLFDNIIIGRAANTAINADRAVAYIPVTVGEKYTISYNDISNFDAVYWYQKATIDTIPSVTEGVVSDNLTLTISAGVTYLAIQFNKTAISESDFSSLLMQVEHGISKTDYIPHRSLIDHVAREAGQNANYILSKEITTFKNIICCGDSLTAGTFNHNDQGYTEFEVYPDYSYPTYLEKLTGCNVTNLGIGGRTSDEWYADEASADLSGYDCAILQFGVNDAIRYGDWTAASIGGFTDIINKLQSENNNIFIFVATVIPSIAYVGSAYTKVSNGIRNFVGSLNDDHVILIDLANYGHTAETTGYNCGHLSALGYQRLAQDYVSMISEYMAENRVLFRQIQFIGTTYSYTG